MVLGQYAISFVQGFEHAPEDPFTLQASACCKHFVGEFDDARFVTQVLRLMSLKMPDAIPIATARRPLCPANELDNSDGTDR